MAMNMTLTMIKVWSIGNKERARTKSDIPTMIIVKLGWLEFVYGINSDHIPGMVY